MIQDQHGVLVYNMLIDNLTYIKKSQIHGWGLFAINPLYKGDIITQSPGITFKIGSYCPPEICTYTFPLPKEGLILCLGSPSLINHSIKPNSVYEIDILNNILSIKALRNIKSDEEITLRYMN